MARIVLTSWGTYGDLDPYIALGLGLRSRGHEVRLAVPALYGPAVKRAGLEFRPVRPDVSLDTPEWAGRAMDARRGSEVAFREMLLPAVEDSFQDLLAAARDADLLVSHPAAFAAPVVADHTGIRWTSTVLSPMSFFSACDPPVLAGAPWAKTAERRLGPWVGRLMMRMMRAGIRGWSDPVFRLRERLGLPRGGEPVLEGQHSPHQVLALFTRVLAEPQPDWPPHTRVTGALLHDGTHGVGLDPELEAFLEAGDPPVVFTMGSSAPLAAGDLYARGVEAARLIGCRAVLLVGARRHSEFAALRDPAVLAVASAPHSALFPRSAAVVQHCGVGTLTQALRAGVPVLAVPFAHDQADNAYRAERLGVARILRPSAATGVRMASELRVLLEDGGYRDRVRRVSARVKAEDGLSTACEALEAMVSAPG